MSGEERRRRGSGTVYPDPVRGGWVASLPVAVRNGKRVRKRARAGSEAEALLRLDELRLRWAPDREADALTLDDWLGSWLASVRSTVRPATWTSYSGHVEQHIAPLLGGIRLRDLRPADVHRLQRELLAKTARRGGQKPDAEHAHPLSANTVARILTTLRIALAAAVREELVPANVAAMTGKLPRAERPQVEPMTDALLDRYLDAFRETWLGPLVRLLAGSGLRLGEALSLDQGDVEPDARFVRIRRSKTTIRAVPISPDAAEACKAALSACPVRGVREPLFWSPRPRRNGRGRGRLDGGSVSHAVPEIATAAGLPRITPHGFRHGAATLLVSRGAHMRLIAAQLGHANPALTARIYAHVVPESARELGAMLEVRKA